MQPLLRERQAPLVVGGVLLLSLFYLVPVLAAGNYRRGAILAAYGLMAVIAFMVLKDWRRGIIAFSIWIVFEDLIRKSIVGGLIVYFVKDLLILITYISYAVTGWLGRRDKFKNPVTLPLLLCFGWALVECLNPNLTSILVPGIGLRMTFFYIPMIYLGYSFVDGEKRLRDLSFLVLSAGLVVSIIGIVQSIWGMEILNPAASRDIFQLSDIRFSPESGMEVPRVSSVFVDTGRFSGYMFLLFFVGLGLAGLLYARKKKGRTILLERGWMWICWLFVLAGLVVSGQRATILWVLMTPVALLIDQAARLAGRGHRVRASTSRPWVRLGVAAALGLGVAVLLFPERFAAAYHLYVESFDPAGKGGQLILHRPVSYWNDIVRAFGLTGHGTGSGSLGLQYAAKFDPQATIKYNVEGGYASVLWEWGVVGLLIWLWWSVGLVWKLWVTTIKLRGTVYHLYGFSIFLFAFFVLIAWFFLGFQVYQNYLTQAYLWFLAGAAFKLPLLAKMAATGKSGPPRPQADARS